MRIVASKYFRYGMDDPRRDRGLREVAAALPLERILVETDAPLLAPEGYRGRRNEPAYVVKVLELVASLRAIEVEALAARLTRNFDELFGPDLSTVVEEPS